MARRLAPALGAIVIALSLLSPAFSSQRWSEVTRSVEKLPCKVSRIEEGRTSKNLRTLATQALPPDIGTGELDAKGDLLLGHIYDSPGGLVTVDISDPLRSRILAVFRLEGNFTYDVKVTRDRSTALLGLDDGIASAGVAVVDIRDPSMPRLTDRWTSPRPGALQNGHMLYTARIDGTDWVFLAPNDSTGVWILKLVGPPGKRKIEYVTNTLLIEGGPLGPHDMYVAFDKALKTWILYAADGYEGWLAYDIGDPPAPQFVGGFLHPSSGYTHTIQAGMVGGRRIVATVEEVGANFLKVYDATNLATPVLLGVWSTDNGTPLSSQHNIQIVGPYLYMAHYAQGVYIFDLTESVKEPSLLSSDIRPMGLYRPSGPGFWDIILEDGVLYAGKTGRGSGFDAVGFGCIRPGDKRLSSTG